MVWMQRIKVLLLTSFILALCTLILVKHLTPEKITWPPLKSFRTNSTQTTAGPVTSQQTDKEEATNTTISLFVRMSGKRADHRQRYLCNVFRTAVLFWPPSFGKSVIGLDEESQEDHEFAENLRIQAKKYFPDRELEFHYEALPKDKGTLEFQGSPKTPGYNRQLWSSFFTDLLSNDTVIAYMDSDSSFFTPVTKSTIFNGTKVRALGTGCTFKWRWVNTWARTTQMALGLPFVVDFMTYFPVYMYRDTVTNCREHILKHFNTRNFEEAFRKFYKGFISPVSVLMSYAWYFERERYDWNFEICDDLAEYNKRFPNAGHIIGPEHVETILSEPQTAWHGHAGTALNKNVLASYCLSHKAAGNKLDICSNHSVSLSDNLLFFVHDLQRPLDRNPCKGNNTNTCLQILERHYNQVGLEIKQGRKLEWSNLERADKLASEFDIKCPPIKV